MEKTEIERRFLLYPCSMKRFLKRHTIACRTVKMVQFYLVADDERVERYRKEDGKYVRTLKHGAGLVREEFEERITKEAFEEALRRNRGGVIRKVRRIFGYRGRLFELDSFKGVLKGLNILEIEFESAEEAKRFELPEPFNRLTIAEVTEDRRFSNGALSRSGKIPTIGVGLAALLESIDRRETFLKASTAVALTPYEKCANALKAIVYTLLRSIEANKKTILAKTEDPERLHQLRVAMRKLRALLSQMAPFFDEEWRHFHKEKLAALMRETGAKRDIDVYLLEIPRYRQMVPESLVGGIDALETYLLEQKKVQERFVENFLESERFLKEMAELLRFAAEEGSEGLSEKAAIPVILGVSKRLRYRYKKVLKKGALIDADSPAHHYHMVRIDVKKLRYMMEFFSSILEPDAYAQMLKKLKAIQTILGEHQDLDVQREHLKAFAKVPELHNEKTMRAIDSLRDAMAKLEREKRKRFRELFEEFSRTDDLFHRMVCRF
ncbi:CHAD domain-containing protein [Hydrogenimonas urashimensis]|uniref:CYTH and CHAD domain-containing protein n=1 Tax=Hydrogenimonas urashimensis TaxID=2740515 RepID=UPI0019157F92|nr:CHAD domain-containing protein [Hydrogenimonas urashimensis]